MSYSGRLAQLEASAGPLVKGVPQCSSWKLDCRWSISIRGDRGPWTNCWRSYGSSCLWTQTQTSRMVDLS